jgi:hypothetical protein
MKTILAFVFLCFYMFTLQAQLLHSTDFESQPIGSAYTRHFGKQTGLPPTHGIMD